MTIMSKKSSSLGLLSHSTKVAPPHPPPPAAAAAAAATRGKGKKGTGWSLEGIFRSLLVAVGIFYLGVWVGYEMRQLDARDASVSARASGQCVCDCDGIAPTTTLSPNTINNNNNNNNNKINSKSELQLRGGPLPPKTIARSMESKTAAAAAAAAATASQSEAIETMATEAVQTSSPTKDEPTPAPQAIKKPTQLPPFSKTDPSTASTASCPEKTQPHHQEIFVPRHTGHFASGMEFVDRDEFGATFDTGAPFDSSSSRNNRVVILYSDGKAFPDKNATRRDYKKSGSVLSVEDATKNCVNLHVVQTSDSRTSQCIAVVAQYEGFHLQKFMRSRDSRKQEKRVADKSAPFRLVPRGFQLNGAESHYVPKRHHYEAFWPLLVSYLSSVSKVLEDLAPIAKAVAAHNNNNAIVVLVCNHGHVEMLLNFICHARAGGAETTEALGNVLVFATDAETHDLVTSMGLTSFYSEAIFGGIPTKAAQQYGDQRYSRIMLAKVYCVHLVSQLGYDVLFQDVDVIWYRNPLTWFHTNKNSPLMAENGGFDMVFQDDGARTLFYAPYSANTGFYYVRCNEKTQFLINTLVVQGDLIMSAASHQSVLIGMLTEHASLYGLKIKTWNRATSEFPGGQTYHQRKDFMRQLVIQHHRKRIGLTGPIESNHTVLQNPGAKIEPYIFHMSWTANKDNKLKFFEQMGDWFLESTCNSDSNGDSNGDSNSNSNSDSDSNSNGTNTTSKVEYTPSNCCAAKPIIRCHYRDKASVIPCPDAPPATKENLPSFW